MDYPNIFNFAFLELIPLDMNYFLNVVLPILTKLVLITFALIFKSDINL